MALWGSGRAARGPKTSGVAQARGTARDLPSKAFPKRLWHRPKELIRRDRAGAGREQRALVRCNRSRRAAGRRQGGRPQRGDGPGAREGRSITAGPEPASTGPGDRVGCTLRRWVGGRSRYAAAGRAEGATVGRGLRSGVGRLAVGRGVHWPGRKGWFLVVRTIWGWRAGGRPRRPPGRSPHGEQRAAVDRWTH